MKFNINDYISIRKEIVDKKLLELFPKSNNDLSILHESMRYSILAGGKRLRPILCIAAAEVFGGSIERALPAACAIEMVHTYSLIHDDLPSMDNDLLRRGKPTNHSVYGEALAILAGDALLTDAFRLIAEEGLAKGLTPSLIVDVIMDISKATGSEGMVKGQAIDLCLEGSDDVSLETTEEVHSLKTGSLIEASVITGGRIGGGSNKELSGLRLYSRALGLAFQIIDDVLDVEGGGELGKDRGMDAKREKMTYPGLIGVKKAKEIAWKLTEDAVSAIRDFDDNARPLREIALYLGGRKY